MISFLLTFSLCVFSFPSCHFGKLYGLVMALSAVFSLLQYPCFALVKVLDGDPLYVNTFLWSILAPYLILSLLTSSSFFLHFFSRWTLVWHCSACWPSSTPSQSTCTVEAFPPSGSRIKPWRSLLKVCTVTHSYKFTTIENYLFNLFHVVQVLFPHSWQEVFVCSSGSVLK